MQTEMNEHRPLCFVVSFDASYEQPAGNSPQAFKESALCRYPPGEIV